MADARNKAVHLARGKYLFMMDADNLLLSDALKQLLELIQVAPPEETAIILPESGISVSYQQLRDQAQTPHGAVVRGEVRILEQPRRLRVGGRAEAEQDPGRLELLRQAEQRR